MRTVSESQRPVQGILSRGKVLRLPDRMDSVHLCVVEKEQGVAGRGEEIVVDARDERMAREMRVGEDIRLEGMDTWYWSVLLD